MTIAAPSTTTRLLGAVAAGAGPGLAEHRQVFGLVPMPGRGRRAWQSLLDEVAAAGLAGRGGAGFPTGTKLALAAGQRRGTVLVVNAMEGEPASWKDRLLLERSPHLVLDGAQCAAMAVGSEEIVLCTAAEHSAAARAVQHALDERERNGSSSVPMRLELVPGRYAAGEESALVSWVAGGSGLPAYRPDKGVPLRVRRRAALLQNAETLAHVALTGPPFPCR